EMTRTSLSSGPGLGWGFPTTASHRPSGDQASSVGAIVPDVSRRASPPSGAMIHTCFSPLRSEMKAIQARSGDHRGLVSLPGTEVSGHAARPSPGTIQRWVWDAFAAASAVVTVHTTWDPSGASCGSLTIFKASRSSIVIGRPAGADRKSTRLYSSLVKISYDVFCLKKKNKNK